LEEGQICPTCNRALEDIDHTDEINKLKELIESLQLTQTEARKKFLDLSTKEKKYSELKKQFDEYERNKLKKARYELEHQQKELEIGTIQLKIDNYEKNKQKLIENQELDAESTRLGTQIESITATIRQFSSTIERLSTQNETIVIKIETNNGLIKKIKIENDTQAIFKVYLTVFGKNGISKIIMKTMIPLINSELQRLMEDSCYFKLEIRINDKNEVEFIMIDNSTGIDKNMSSGSGYERTIASLALRSVLSKICSLPKPNLIVFDEVFGKISNDNLELVYEFFIKIKEYFENILVITHNPLISQWADNTIKVKKVDNISKVVN